MKSSSIGQVWPYSTVHNSAGKEERRTDLMGADGVPCRVAEPGRGGARAPLRFAAAGCRPAAGDRSRALAYATACLLQNTVMMSLSKTGGGESWPKSKEFE